MRCEHCLRGDAENKSMDGDSFRNIVDKYSIDNLTITGGEPLLNKEVLRELNSMEFSILWFATSGAIPKTSVQEVIEFILDRKNRSWEEFSFSISTDYYHKGEQLSRIYHFLDQLELYGIEYSKKDNFKYGGTPIYMGRGVNNGGRELKISLDIEDAELYINVDGDIYPSCDLSYEFQREFKGDLCLGNAFKDSLEAIEEAYVRLTDKWDEIYCTEGSWHGTRRKELV